MKTIKTLAPRFLPFIISVVSDTDFNSSFKSNIIRYYEITMKAMDGWVDWWRGRWILDS